MLSIIIPVYNEVKTIDKVIAKISKIKNIKKQIIIIDDGSNINLSDTKHAIGGGSKIDISYSSHIGKKNDN